jgi:hypothetical protein
MTTPKVTEIIRNGNPVGTGHASEQGADVTPPLAIRLRERLRATSSQGLLGPESRVRR